MIRWYNRQARDLPWRRTRDPYKIWISEVMLQQTTVSAVIPYYQRWVREFPAIQDAARAPLLKILRLWQGLGYYQRARNIHKAAQILCALHGGTIPADPCALKRLPGFGPYTAGAVASIAFDIPCPIIDANIRRVMMRVLGLKGYADSSQDQKILAFLQTIMPAKKPGAFNQALMELGALLCRSRAPLCLSCPVKLDCRSRREGLQESIPRPKKRLVQKVEAVAGILRKDKHYFIQRRPSEGLLASLWEFPGGKIESKETSLQALRRAFKEELGADIHSVQPLMRVRHSYTQFHVRLHVFLCRPRTSPREDARHRWVRLPDLVQYPMPSGHARIVEKLQQVAWHLETETTGAQSHRLGHMKMFL